MKYKDILYEKRGRIAIATFNRPDALNAFRNGMLREFQHILEDVRQDNNLHVLILTGKGRAFSAGRDLKDLAFLYEAESSSDQLRQEVQLLARITKQLSQIPKVVIAAINGVAVGIGVEFALACDIRMASDQASFGFPEVRRALFMTNGVMYFLPKLVGMGRAKDWLLTGEIISAQEALEAGLVTGVSPLNELMKSAVDKSNKIAANAPLSIRLTKEAFRQTNEMDLESVLKLEENSVIACHASEDFLEGARAFIEKREPVYKGK
ncbi:MAG: enoyl-CoA hydratase/isomerase family protein [Desulfobacterales bacterium]|jgi:enoyl-CoA hydratase/carnithine racemase